MASVASVARYTLGGMLNRVPPPLLAVAAILSVQFGSAFARTFFGETGSLGAAALRLFFGCLILAAVVRPRVRSWERSTWLGVVALGLALAGMNGFIYLAIDHIPIGVAVTIEFLGPLTVAVVQTRRIADAAWAALALAGVLLLGFDPAGNLEWIGLVLAACAALFWAGYIVLSSRLGAHAVGVAPLSVAMVVAAIVVVPIGAHPALVAVGRHPLLLLFFVIVAVLTSVLPYALEFTALKRMPTRVFGILSSLGPAVAALAGLVVLRESLAVTQLIALALVTVASLGVSLTASAPAPAPEQGV
ncbi:DMT family transporter [soil metagenome]